MLKFCNLATVSLMSSCGFVFFEPTLFIKLVFCLIGTLLGFDPGRLNFRGSDVCAVITHLKLSNCERGSQDVFCSLAI